MTKGKIAAAVAVGFVGVVLLVQVSGVGSGSAPNTQVPPPTTGSVSKALDSVSVTERKNYVDALNNRLRQTSSDAGARESNETLIVKSPELESPSARGPFMSQAFNLASQNALCAMGFRRVTLRGTRLLDSGTDYAVRCKESASEAKEREKREFSEREAFADRFEAAGAQTASNTTSLHVHEYKTEFVMDIGDVDARAVASRLPLLISPSQQTNACGLGFTATRVRSTHNPKGILVPFRCD